jgi:hypothetical protein
MSLNTDPVINAQPIKVSTPRILKTNINHEESNGNNLPVTINQYRLNTQQLPIPPSTIPNFDPYLSTIIPGIQLNTPAAKVALLNVSNWD